MIDKLRWRGLLIILFIFFLPYGCASANNQEKSIRGGNSVSLNQEITFEQAKKIAKQYMEDNELQKKYKLSSASLYERLTDGESIAISFRSGFFNLKRPFSYVVIIVRQTGEISFAGEIK